MSEWVHCSFCLSNPGRKGSSGTFFLSSCGEILCKKCLEENRVLDPVCKLCNQKANVIEINRQLNKDLQLLFLPAKEVMKRHSKQLSSILNFQSKHQNRQSKYYRDQLSKAGKMCEMFQKEMKKKAEIEKGYATLKEQYNVLLKEHQEAKEQLQSLRERTKMSRQLFSQTKTPSPLFGHQVFGQFQNPAAVSTPRNVSLTAGRITVGLRGSGDGMSSGGVQNSVSSPTFSEVGGVTTPVLLTGQKKQFQEEQQGNPYSEVWQKSKSPGRYQVIPHNIMGSQFTRRTPTGTNRRQSPFKLV